jgi:nucleoside-diphosphate-sugar epimerase
MTIPLSRYPNRPPRRSPVEDDRVPDYRDVAEVAAKALTEDEFAFGIFDLSAAGMISREDIVNMMTKALGRPITTRTQPIQEWIEENMPNDPVLRDAFSGIHRFYSRYGFPGGNDLVLRTILGREPRTMAAYIAELAAESVKSRQISG